MNGCINVEDFSETYMSEYEAKFSELSFREKLLVVGVFVIALLAASILVSIMKTEDAEHIRIRTEDETFEFRKVIL